MRSAPACRKIATGQGEEAMRLAGLNGAFFCMAFCPGAAFAADVLVTESPAPPAAASLAPRLSVVGTLSATWTDNAAFSKNNRQGDGYLEPDISVRLDGYLTPDLLYRIYGRTEFDRFSRVRDADAAFALWGARISRDVGGWFASVIYENRYEFAGFYDERLFTANDIKLSLVRDYSFGLWTLTPFVQGRYRFSDLQEAEHYRLELVLGIEAKLNERWSVVSEPFYEAYWFTGGLNDGRVDHIYSGSIGLKYKLAPNVSLVTMLAYEERFSNFDTRRYRSLDVGPKLNFAF
jgi:hypothetical protein